jgi:hypothetical protein
MKMDDDIGTMRAGQNAVIENHVLKELEMRLDTSFSDIN